MTDVDKAFEELEATENRANAVRGLIRATAPTAHMVARLVNPRILGAAARGQHCSTCTHPAVVVLLVEGVPEVGQPACRRHTRPVFEELNAQYPPPQ